jgi:DNA invertase Pin-like site-specific DNA recombinase
LRCAIYTRKSTEDGLEQDFNSLHAQREACAAFVQSQVGQGWQVIDETFDDGGISGATMDRPSLRLLLERIVEGKVDIVVVYKIDRLTRSLMDFARMVELFDKHQISFVSVTQQFNTTTSMGRLTLNVLLSFAQFEREVTAERIRDKIAASKKKGIWMGGLAPLGYDIANRHLVVNAKEADTVREIYRFFLGCDGVRELKEELDRRGVISKVRTYANGTTVGGVPLSRGMLYRLLSNPIYIGRIAHKGKTYPGQHEAIVPKDVWEAVQHKLADNRSDRRSHCNASHPSLLTGLLFDETGDRLTPTHANNHGRRYRFYISHRLMTARSKDVGGWRIPALELENGVVKGLAQILRDPRQLIDLTQMRQADAAFLDCYCSNATRIAHELEANGAERSLINKAISRIEVRPGELELQISRSGLLSLLADTQSEQFAINLGDVTKINLPFQFRRRGVEARLVLDDAGSSAGKQDPNLIALVRDAHRWMNALTDREVSSVNELAAREAVPASEISRTLPIAFLAPDITRAILLGNQATDLTAERLKRIGKLPASWAEQRRLLGISA